nr:venom peptide Pc [Bactrocera oleae]
MHKVKVADANRTVSYCTLRRADIHCYCICVMAMQPLLVAAILLLCCDLGQAADCEFGERQFNIGENFENPGECAIYHCDAEGSISAKSCAESLPPPNCKTIPQDNTKPYPDCCKRHDC